MWVERIPPKRGTMSTENKTEKKKATKINLGSKVRAANIADALESNGFSIERVEGVTYLTLNFPGVAPIQVTRDQLAMIVGRLDEPRLKGEDPGSVFVRSATEDPDGELVARFSDEKRARTVTFTPEDRSNVAILLESKLDQWDEFERMLDDALGVSSEDTETPEDENTSE